LTTASATGNVKYMPRFIFAALASVAIAHSAGAQRVPGRDLLEFPLGLLAEAPGLSRIMTAGLWNPANVALRPGDRVEVGIAALVTSSDQAVQSKLVGADYRVRHDLTASLSVMQASVSDIFKTETDPQTLAEIPYGTTLLSAGVAAHRGLHSVGFATRYRWGTIDTEQRGALSVDGGLLLDHPFDIPVRLAASTFLFTPKRGEEGPTYILAGDIPVAGNDSSWKTRAGYSFTQAAERGSESYSFLTVRYRQLDASTGIAQGTAFGNVNTRLRIGLGLRYARYTVAVAREAGVVGIGGTYQFLLTSAYR
jgi:hypothetical protein